MFTKYTENIRETAKRYQEKMAQGSYGWTLAGAALEEADIVDNVLPEALALLKRIQEWDERFEECPEATGRCPLPEISELLRRAGVLE